MHASKSGYLLKSWLPAEQQQGIEVHALQICQSLSVPFSQYLIYSMPNWVSTNYTNKRFLLGHFLLWRTKKPRFQIETLSTCSGAPLLTLCILPAWSMYVSAVLLSVGLNGRKWISVIPARALQMNPGETQFNEALVNETHDCICKVQNYTGNLIA